MKTIISLPCFLIFTLQSFSQIQFQEHVIFEQYFSSPSRINSLDVDGDADYDLLITDINSNRLIWVENQDNGNFQNINVLIDDFGYPAETEIYDIDGNGKLDILISNISSDKLEWLKNNGLGNFSTMIIDSVSDSPKGAKCADIDNDGDLDVIGVSLFDNQVFFYLNDGNGNFCSKQIISTAVSAPVAVCAADIDRDDFIDIVSVSLFDSKIAWYKNLGNGSFSSQIIISTLFQSPWSLASGDYDADGNIDLVVNTGDNPRYNVIFNNSGYGSFTVQQLLLTDKLSREVFNTDLDNDGDIDAISPMHYYLNDGTGSFVGHETDSYPDRITFGDFTNDGLKDIAYIFNTGNLAWRTNIGNGLFSDRHLLLSSIRHIDKICFEDLDNDNQNEIIIGASDTNNSICWYKNQGGGEYLKQDTALVGYYVFDLQIVDLNGDGAKDLLYHLDTLSSQFSKICCQFNDGFGQFLPYQIIKDSVPDLGRILFGDLDGDGDNDILFSEQVSTNYSKLNWMINDSSGNFDIPVTLRNCTEKSPDLKIADINNDGKLDILFINTSLIIGINQGGVGNFLYSYLPSTSEGASATHYGDIDGDGDLDIVCAVRPLVPSSGHCLRLFRNNGLSTPSFMDQLITDTWSTDEVILKDIDTDGDLDIFSEQTDSANSLYWMENDGTGSFSPKVSLYDSVSVLSFLVDDIDNDGDMDVLYVIRKALHSCLAWAENTGFQTIDSVTSCANIPYQLGNQLLTTPGLYKDSLSSINGLDSIVHVTFSHIPLPHVELAPFPFDTICIEELVTPLPIGTPIGGNFFGNSIVNNEINLSTAGEGNYILGYTYLDTISGCSDTSYSAMNIVACISIAEIGEFPGLAVYPNPSNGFITIEIQSPEITVNLNHLQYKIYSLDGQLHQASNLTSILEIIDLSHLKAGIYFLIIQKGSSKRVYKLIIH